MFFQRFILLLRILGKLSFHLCCFPMNHMLSSFCLPLLKQEKGFPHGSVGKESTCNAEDPGLIPGSERFAGEGIGYPLQYSWASLVAQLVKNLPAMWGTWVWFWVGKILWRREQLPTVHGVTKSRTLSNFQGVFLEGVTVFLKTESC